MVIAVEPPLKYTLVRKTRPEYRALREWASVATDTGRNQGRGRLGLRGWVG